MTAPDSATGGTLTDAEIEAVRWVRSRLIAAKAEADMCGMDGGNLAGFRAICSRVFLDIFRPIDEYDAAMTHLARLAGAGEVQS